MSIVPHHSHAEYDIRVIGGIPLTSYFVIFDFVINNPKAAETTANLALLDMAAGHFSRIEYASDGYLPGSLLGGFAHIAREYVNSIPCNEGSASRHITMSISDEADKADISSSTARFFTGNENVIDPDTASSDAACSTQIAANVSLSVILACGTNSATGPALRQRRTPVHGRVVFPN